MILEDGMAAFDKVGARYNTCLFKNDYYYYYYYYYYSVSKIALLLDI